MVTFPPNFRPYNVTPLSRTFCFFFYELSTPLTPLSGTVFASFFLYLDPPHSPPIFRWDFFMSPVRCKRLPIFGILDSLFLLIPPFQRTSQPPSAFAPRLYLFPPYLGGFTVKDLSYITMRRPSLTENLSLFVSDVCLAFPLQREEVPHEQISARLKPSRSFFVPSGGNPLSSVFLGEKGPP